MPRPPTILIPYALLFSCGFGTALADSIPGDQSRATYAPIAVIQATPGVHLTISGGKLGVGASVDVLGGLVLNGERCFCITPGVVGGGFAEIHAVLGQGVTRTIGWRAGGGALAPTLGGGFMSFGLLTYDWAQARGAVRGIRTGLRSRSIFGSVSVNRMDDGRFVSTLDVEYPLLPFPWVE